MRAIGSGSGNIDSERRGAWTIISLTGVVPESDALVLRGLIDDAAGAQQSIAVELTETLLVEEDCVGALMVGLKHAERNGLGVRLVAPTGVPPTLNLIRADRVFTVIRSLDELGLGP